MTKTVKALIFDLDNCIAPAKAIGEELYAPVFSSIKQANQGVFDERELEHIYFEIWRHPLDWVAQRYNFSEDMFKLVWEIFCEMKVTEPMTGYGDFDDVIGLTQKKFLVTSGFTKLQKSKIKALKLDSYFDQIYIDAVDSTNRIGKEGIFKKIMNEFNLSNNEVVVIGDNEDSEIRAGNLLGLNTIQTLRSEVPFSCHASYHIKSFSELGKIISDISAT